MERKGFRPSEKLPFAFHPSFLYLKMGCGGLSWGQTPVPPTADIEHTTVLKYLKIAGASIRPTGSNVNRKRGISYGTDSGPKYPQNLDEQKFVQKMHSLRRQGFTYREIADVFNSMEVPTKTGLSKWHGKTMQRILGSSKKGNL